MNDCVALILLLTVAANVRPTDSFEQISVEVSLKEEQDNGTTVVDLRSFVRADPQRYVTRFVRPCPNIYVDENDPLTVRSLKIDRERICPHEKICQLSCDLLLQSEDAKLIKLKVNVEDINDHRPSFSKRFYSHEFNESLVEGFRIPLEQAEDRDSAEPHSIKSYRLSPVNSTYFPFRLVDDRENHLLELISTEHLGGRSRQEKFLFELIVDDGGNQEDRCLVEINILAGQPNHNLPPKFDRSLYRFTVTNASQTLVGTVHAEDPLASNRQQIYYRLIPSTDDSALFLINETTGQIFLDAKQQPDVSNRFHQMFVEAFYSNYLSALTTVQISFNLTEPTGSDERENFIQLLIPKLFRRHQHKIHLKENLPVPTTILQLFVVASSFYSLELAASIDKNHFYLKRVDQQLFELVLLQSLDFETTPSVRLDFVLNKQDSTRRSAEIVVENVNDCQPVFNRTDFAFRVQENNPVPLLLHTFHAFDQDFLDPIVYQIQSSDEQVFSINATTGDLWTLKSFDRETKSNYTLLVCAFDGTHRTCSVATVDVLDENDNVCHFESPSVTLTVDENLPTDTDLVHVRAFDPDYKQNGSLHYKLSPKTPYLKINAATGLVQTTARPFDAELVQSHTALVVACDNTDSSPSLCCHLRLHVTINDVDDNAPRLVFPASTSELLVVNYANRTMPRLQAADNDVDLKNRFVSFAVTGGSLSTSITVDSLSGQLHLSPTARLPLYGTLTLSLSSRTSVHLTVLVHENQTDPHHFLVSLQRYALSSRSFYFISFMSAVTMLFVAIATFLAFYLVKHKHKHDDGPLMNTPSTTTLSARSGSATSNKRTYDTYYSFGDSVAADVIHV